MATSPRAKAAPKVKAAEAKPVTKPLLASKAKTTAAKASQPR